jgi:hypothetical protein
LAAEVEAVLSTIPQWVELHQHAPDHRCSRERHAHLLIAVARRVTVDNECSAEAICTGRYDGRYDDVTVPKKWRDFDIEPFVSTHDVGGQIIEYRCRCCGDELILRHLQPSVIMSGAGAICGAQSGRMTLIDTAVYFPHVVTCLECAKAIPAACFCWFVARILDGKMLWIGPLPPCGICGADKVKDFGDGWTCWECGAHSDDRGELWIRRQGRAQTEGA